MEQYILALDQGTTSSRAILFDRRGRSPRWDSITSPRSIPKPAGWSTTRGTFGARRAGRRQTPCVRCGRAR